MVPANDGIIWIFLHLPKTGGTTFGVHVAKYWAFDDVYVNLSNWGRSYRREHRRLGLVDRDEAAQQRIRLISGHQAYYGVHELVPDKQPRYFTFVRQPAERLVSLFNYRRSTGRVDQPFDAWRDRQAQPECRNPMTKFYAGCLLRQRQVGDDPTENLRAAKAMLDRCWLVSVTEFLNEDLPKVFAAMGLPAGWSNMRVAGEPPPLSLRAKQRHPAAREKLQRHVELDDNLGKQLMADHPQDVELYEYAVQKRQQCLAAIFPRPSMGTQERRTPPLSKTGHQDIVRA